MTSKRSLIYAGNSHIYPAEAEFLFGASEW